VLGSAQSMQELGEDFGCGLARRELDYLIAEEWARTAEDVLWRRSKLGLHMTPPQQQNVARAIGRSPFGARRS
jgi:glycerol-3-phosphate dehydrogenase